MPYSFQSRGFFFASLVRMTAGDNPLHRSCDSFTPKLSIFPVRFLFYYFRPRKFNAILRRIRRSSSPFQMQARQRSVASRLFYLSCSLIMSFFRPRKFYCAVFHRICPNPFQMQARQGERGFADGSLLYVNEQGKTQVQRCIAQYFKRGIEEFQKRDLVKSNVLNPLFEHLNAATLLANSQASFTFFPWQYAVTNAPWKVSPAPLVSTAFTFTLS